MIEDSMTAVEGGVVSSYHIFTEYHPKVTRHLYNLIYLNNFSYARQSRTEEHSTKESI